MKVRRPDVLSANQQQEVKRDRRRLAIGAGIGTLGALGLGGYLSQDTVPGMKVKSAWKNSPRGAKWGAALSVAGREIAKLFRSPKSSKLLSGAGKSKPKPKSNIVPGPGAGTTPVTPKKPTKPKPKLTKKPTKKKFASLDAEILFTIKSQIKDTVTKEYAPPMRAAMGGKWYIGNKTIDIDAKTGAPRLDKEGRPKMTWKAEDVPVLHHQVVKHAYQQARGLAKWANRGVGLVRDTSDVVRGVPRQLDASGRKRKREWEKAWFRNVAIGAAGAGATLGVIRHAKYNPKGKIAKGLKAARIGIGNLRKVLYSRQDLDREILLDESAPNWDIRDERGRSARVFAPGSRARQRRDKYWHERLSNERKLWAGGLLAAGILGAGVTHKLYRRGVLKLPKLPRAPRKRTTIPVADGKITQITQPLPKKTA